MNAAEISGLFDQLFLKDHQTRLVGGFDEPFYRSPRPGRGGEIRFRENFAASALHEVAHWCIAGRRRREQDDFGYWYEADRDEVAQDTFEQLEVGVQGLEWVLCVAAGVPFRVSVDNFRVDNRDRLRKRVRQAVLDRIASGLPPRARTFADALAGVSGRADYLSVANYEEEPL